jgi:hypothetical protein
MNKPKPMAPIRGDVGGHGGDSVWNVGEWNEARLHELQMSGDGRLDGFHLSIICGEVHFGRSAW